MYATDIVIWVNLGTGEYTLQICIRLRTLSLKQAPLFIQHNWLCTHISELDQRVSN